MKHSISQVLAGIVLLLLLSAACKKSDSGTTGNAGSTSSPPVQPTNKASEPAPAAPAKPTPSFSAARKIGLFAYPKKDQSSDQQLRDEYECYTLVQQQTGINPETPPPSRPSSAEVQAAQQQAAANAGQAEGGRARGAARGALGGAAIGGIAGSAGKGAAIGAVGGTMHGGRKQREANAAAKEEAAQSANSQLEGQYTQAKAGYNKKMDTFKRGFSACMDARAYSVK